MFENEINLIVSNVKERLVNEKDLDKVLNEEILKLNVLDEVEDIIVMEIKKRLKEVLK